MNILYGDKYVAYSAGIEPTKVDPYVIKVMAEIGIDISGYRTKSIQEFRTKHFNYVVIVCDDAKEARALKKGTAVTKTELIRRAIDEFVEKHSEMFT